MSIGLAGTWSLGGPGGLGCANSSVSFPTVCKMSPSHKGVCVQPPHLLKMRGRGFPAHHNPLAHSKHEVEGFMPTTTPLAHSNQFTIPPLA